VFRYDQTLFDVNGHQWRGDVLIEVVGSGDSMEFVFIRAQFEGITRVIEPAIFLKDNPHLKQWVYEDFTSPNNAQVGDLYANP
jgi:hypothetical protein